jgi:hypothetical protein
MYFNDINCIYWIGRIWCAPKFFAIEYGLTIWSSQWIWKEANGSMLECKLSRNYYLVYYGQQNSTLVYGG